MEAGPEELDELRHDATLAEHLGHGQNEVGRRGALRQLALEPEAEHLRQQHRDRLAEHRRLGFDPADAPAEDAQAVDHRGVGVGPDQRVGVGLHDAVRLPAEDDFGDVLEVDLMADPGRGRHHAEVVEGLLAPAQERVALLVPLVVAVRVDVEGARVPERIHLHRVVDDQVDGHQRIDLLRIGAELFHRVAHRGEIDDGGDAGEVLHQDAGRLVGDLLGRLGLRVPARDRLDVLLRDRLAVLEAKGVLEQDLQRVGKAGDVELLLKHVEAIDLVFVPRDVERVLGSKAVLHASSFSGVVRGEGSCRDRL